MIQLKSRWLAAIAAVVISIATPAVHAEDKLKPFVLASTSTGGTVVDHIESVRNALTGEGFEIAGE